MEKCVGIILNLKEIINIAGTGKEQQSLNEMISSACEELKQRMVTEVLSSAKDHVIRRYIQFHQAGLVTLSDNVFYQLRSASTPLVPGKTDLLVHTLRTLQQLLIYIDQRFYNFYDSVHGISQFQSDHISNRLRTEIEHIAPLLESAQIDHALAEVFLRSMEECLDNLRVRTITLDQQKYYDQLLELIKSHLQEEQTDSASFAGLLYRQNFNSTYFEIWYRESHLHIRSSRDIHESQLMMIEPVITDQGIFPGRQSLDILLRDWLSTLMGYQAGKARTNKNLEAILTRLPLLLSVPQLALFVRLCYLEGCFQISNISNIMRFFTDHFETKKQSNISVKSFSRAFYNADQATAAMVRDFLQRMTGIIDKTYFPKT